MAHMDGADLVDVADGPARGSVRDVEFKEIVLLLLQRLHTRETNTDERVDSNDRRLAAIEAELDGLLSSGGSHHPQPRSDPNNESRGRLRAVGGATEASAVELGALLDGMEMVLHPRPEADVPVSKYRNVRYSAYAVTFIYLVVTFITGIADGPAVTTGAHRH